MYYALTFKNDNSIIPCKSKQEVSVKANVGITTVNSWLEGSTSPNYKLKEITFREYKILIKEQASRNTVRTLESFAPKQNNNNILNIIKIKTKERLQKLKFIKEHYKHKPELMNTLIKLEKKQSNEIEVRNHTFVWNEINNAYKKI